MHYITIFTVRKCSFRSHALGDALYPTVSWVVIF